MVNSHGRFVWYELMTTDIEIAKAFYASVVGWGTRDASMPGLAYSLFTIGDFPVTGLVNVPEDARRTGVTPHWIGYVGVDDVDAAVDRIKQLGGAVYVPPTDVPNISRFSVVADPQTATLALLKGLKSGQAQSAELGTPGRVGWHELLAADWEKAFAFYGELFGWQKADSHFGVMGTYQGFSAGGETIGGMFTKPATLPLPFWLYYFNIDDVQVAAKRVEAGGGQILYGPTAVPGGAWIVHCTDPQGAIFALLDRRSRKAIGYIYFERVASRDPADALSHDGLDKPGNRRLIGIARRLRPFHRHLRGRCAATLSDAHAIVSRKLPISRRDRSQTDRRVPRRGIRPPSSLRTDRYSRSRPHIRRAPCRSPPGKAFALILRRPSE